MRFAGTDIPICEHDPLNRLGAPPKKRQHATIQETPMQQAAQPPIDKLTAEFTDSELERSAIRKAGWRLIPIVALGYFLAYLDRTSVGFGALTMLKTLEMSATQFGLGAGLMFAAYCLCEVPSNLGLYRYGARRWIARIMISWGIAAAATGLAIGPKSFYLTRIVLGIAEAGFFPGVVFYLTLWFPKPYRTRVLAWFTVSTPLSSFVGGPLSVSLLHLDGTWGLAGWQWMFIAEGLPACVLGIVTLYMLTDRPKDAKWLTPGERDALERVLANEVKTDPQTHVFLPVLRDPRTYILGLISFSFSMGSYGVAIWLPQILKGHGISITMTGWLSAIPYFFASALMLIWAAHVDRTGKRIFHLALTCLLGALGLIFSILFNQLLPAMIGITFALIGTITARTVFFTIPSRFLSGQAAAGGIALINCIGAFGGFVGPYLVGYLKDRTGEFSAGMIGMAVVLIIATGLTVSLRAFMKDG
jgi:sugar phosphate permease